MHRDDNPRSILLHSSLQEGKAVAVWSIFALSCSFFYNHSSDAVHDMVPYSPQITDSGMTKIIFTSIITYPLATFPRPGYRLDPHETKWQTLLYCTHLIKTNEKLSLIILRRHLLYLHRWYIFTSKSQTKLAGEKGVSL